MDVIWRASLPTRGRLPIGLTEGSHLYYSFNLCLMPPTLTEWSDPSPPRASRISEARLVERSFPAGTYPDPRDLRAWRAFVDASVRLAHRHLPAGMAAVLDGFFPAGGPDALLIENLPVDPQLPPPPSDGKRPASKTAVSECRDRRADRRHAAIVSYSNEKAGAPIHEITPVTGLEHVPSSAGRAPFACHTDAAFLAPRFLPRGLLLFGLRNQAGAPTAVLPLDRILEAASRGSGAVAEEANLSPSFAIQFRGDGVGDRADCVALTAQGTARIAVQTHAVQPVRIGGRRGAGRHRPTSGAAGFARDRARGPAPGQMHSCSRTTAFCTAATLSPASAGCNGPTSLTPLAPSAKRTGASLRPSSSSTPRRSAKRSPKNACAARLHQS